MIAAASGLDSHVLVLNRLWMAIRVVDARRAFSLVFRDLAEAINVEDGAYSGHDFDDWTELSKARDSFGADSYDWVHTVRLSIAVPKVIRLLGYDRLHQQQVKLNRRNIYARDRNECQYCGRRFSSSELSLDHIVPRSQGGKSTWQNMVCCCLTCNMRKGGRTPKQAHMKLIRQPIRPRRNPVVSLRLGSGKYACWQAFLDNAYWSVELK